MLINNVGDLKKYIEGLDDSLSVMVQDTSAPKPKHAYVNSAEYKLVERISTNGVSTFQDTNLVIGICSAPFNVAAPL